MSRSRRQETLIQPRRRVERATRAASRPLRFPRSIYLWNGIGLLLDGSRRLSVASRSPPDKSKVPLPGHIACLRSGNVQAGVTWSNLLYVPRSVVRSGDQLVREDDILISIANSYALVGKCAIAVGVPFDCLLYTSDAADEEDSVDLG